MQGCKYISCLVNKRLLVRAQTCVNTKKCMNYAGWQASKQTVATVHRYNDNMKNKKIIIIKV